MTNNQGIYTLFELIGVDGSVTRLTNNDPLSRSRSGIYIDGEEWLSTTVSLGSVEITTEAPPTPTVTVLIPKKLQTPFNQKPLLSRGMGIRRIFTDSSVLDHRNFYVANKKPPSAPSVPLSQNTLEQELFQVRRITNHTQQQIEAELTDLTQSWSQIFRPMVPNRCYHKYRDTNCGYQGNKYFDINGKQVSSREEDVCGLSIQDCELRYPTGELPFGGIPEIILNQEV